MNILFNSLNQFTHILSYKQIFKKNFVEVSQNIMFIF